MKKETAETSEWVKNVKKLCSLKACLEEGAMNISLHWDEEGQKKTSCLLVIPTHIRW